MPKLTGNYEIEIDEDYIADMLELCDDPELRSLFGLDSKIVIDGKIIDPELIKPRK